MKKRIMAIVLCVITALLVIACGDKKNTGPEHSNPQVLTEAGVYPIIKDDYKGQIRLKIMGANNAAIDPDWGDNKFFKRMETLTGVGFNFDVFGDDMYTEKKGLTLSTNKNLPDIFFKANFNNYDEVTYGGKTIRPLNGLIDGYAPNIKKILDENPLIKKCITTTDGNIYSLPTVYLNLPDNTENVMRDFLWINQSWLTQLNLKMPQTTGEFLAVLRAFKAKCTANNAYPLAIAGLDHLLRIFNFFGLDMYQYWVQGKDGGGIEFGPTTDKFRTALEFLRTLQKEGLINPNWSSFTAAEMSANGGSGDNVYGCFMTAAPQYVVGFTRMTQYVTIDPLTCPGVNDKSFWSAQLPVQRGCFSITATCKYPEVAIRWIDSLYDLGGEYCLWAVIGKQGEEWKWNANGTWESTVPSSEYSAVMKKTIIQPGDGMPFAVDEEFWGKQSTPEDLFTRPERNKQMTHGWVGYPMVYFNKDDLKKMSDLAADIGSYITDFIAKSMSTEGHIGGKWDDFKKFNRLRLDEYIGILQKSYNDFYS
ncbi:MAG: hypothetical protein LBP26_02275 [Clostridiales bacterium]|jgi:putative aldouronate transport system substrate-binding protein|nr:hypothetical protein [Clostridiales bacterium]